MTFQRNRTSSFTCVYESRWWGTGRTTSPKRRRDNYLVFSSFSSISTSISMCIYVYIYWYVFKRYAVHSHVSKAFPTPSPARTSSQIFCMFHGVLHKSSGMFCTQGRPWNDKPTLSALHWGDGSWCPNLTIKLKQTFFASGQRCPFIVYIDSVYIMFM